MRAWFLNPFWFVCCLSSPTDHGHLHATPIPALNDAADTGAPTPTCSISQGNGEEKGQEESRQPTQKSECCWGKQVWIPPGAQTPTYLLVNEPELRAHTKPLCLAKQTSEGGVRPNFPLACGVRGFRQQTSGKLARGNGHMFAGVDRK